MVAHGAAGMLRDRLCEQSDYYETYVCTKCGLLAEPARPKDLEIPGMSVRASDPYCRNCDSTEYVKKRAMTYAFKLLIQELMSMNMGVRLKHMDDQEILAAHALEESKTRGLDYGLEQDDADVELLELVLERDDLFDSELPPEEEWDVQSEPENDNIHMEIDQDEYERDQEEMLEEQYMEDIAKESRNRQDEDEDFL